MPTHKDVTTQRLFLERMQDVLSKANKIIIDESAEGSKGIVPYLPLNELTESAEGHSNEKRLSSSSV